MVNIFREKIFLIHVSWTRQTVLTRLYEAVSSCWWWQLVKLLNRLYVTIVSWVSPSLSQLKTDSLSLQYEVCQHQTVKQLSLVMKSLLSADNEAGVITNSWVQMVSSVILLQTPTFPQSTLAPSHYYASYHLTALRNVCYNQHMRFSRCYREFHQWTLNTTALCSVNVRLENNGELWSDALLERWNIQKIDLKFDLP